MQTRTHRFPLDGGPADVEIRNPSGSVAVAALEGAKEFTVRIEALDDAAEQLLDRVQVEAGGPRLRVAVPERRLLRAPLFAIAVTVPGGAAGRVATASADLTLRGRLGRLELTTGSGDVAVDSCAELQLRTASGDARVGAVTGDATFGSASGDLRVDAVSGGLEARTASGDVAVGEPAADVSVTTASGDISLGRVAAGTVNLRTMSGDTTVGVAPGLRVWLDLSSVSGRMESQLPDDDAGGEGPAQLSLILRSVSGDLRIRRVAPVA